MKLLRVALLRALAAKTASLCPRGARAALRMAIGAIAILAFAAPALRAHDPYDSFSSATIFPDRLEIVIIMAQSTALRLVDPERNIRALDAESFAKNRALFEREGAALYVVTSGHTRLAAKNVDPRLTEEGDVTFKIAFPHPAPGRLHFHAAFMVKLGEGYGGILDIATAPDKQIGWDQLSWANPNFEVVAPAADKPKTK